MYYSHEKGFEYLAQIGIQWHFFLFGVRLIRLTAIIVYKEKLLSKDCLHMFCKILI